jgi:uncharacterized protein
MRRQLATVIEKYLNRDEPRSNTLIVQGARQVGKTHLVQSILEKREQVCAINLEKTPQDKLAIDSTHSFAEFEVFLKTYYGFQPKKGSVLFIDEAQESKKLGSYVRFFKEEWEGSKVILTGSSMSRLFQVDQRVPVGRVEYLNVHPFSFREFLRMLGQESLLDEALSSKTYPDFLHQKLLNAYDSFLKVGGLPEVVLAYKAQEDYSSVQRFILASQNDDLINKERFKSYLFLDALRGVSNHVGSPSMYTHIAGSYNDAKSISQKLKEWFIMWEVEVLGSLPTQNISPKRYLYDIGILRLVRETSIPSISAVNTLDASLRTPLGGLIENAVLLDLAKHTSGINLISGWKKSSKSDYEVDFILKKNDQTLPIEVKASLNVQKRHMHSLVQYCEYYKISKGFLLSLDVPQKVKLDNIIVECLPAYWDLDTIEELVA